MGHRKYVPRCPWRNAIAVLMSVITFGAWIPYADMPVEPPVEDEASSVPPPIFETHVPPTWPEQVVPHPPVPPSVPHGATKHPKPKPSPSVSPTHSQPTPKVTVTRHPVVPPPEHESATTILVAYLHAQVGKPYLFGGNGPLSFDCSGLTKTAFARIGIHLPRTSQAQSLAGARVSLGDLRVGDLLFYGLVGEAFHVSVYIGHGKAIASENPATGVIEYALSYYPPSFARRVL